MTPRPWFRLYREVLGDRKIARISKTTGRPKALVIGFWATLLCLASGSDRPGMLLLSEGIPFTVEDLADESGLDLATVETFLEQMIALQMLTREPDGTLVVTHWEERQFESDLSTPRVQRHRRARPSNAPEAEGDATFHETPPAFYETLQNQKQNQNQNQDQKQSRTESDQQDGADTEHHAVAVDRSVIAGMMSDSPALQADDPEVGACLAPPEEGMSSAGGEEGDSDKEQRVRALTHEVAMTRDVNYRQACEQLMALGVDPATAKRLAREHPSERIRGWCAYAQRQNSLINPAGFVVDRLTHGLAPPETAQAKRWYTDEEYERFFVRGG